MSPDLRGWRTPRCSPSVCGHLLRREVDFSSVQKKKRLLAYEREVFNGAELMALSPLRIVFFFFFFKKQDSSAPSVFAPPPQPPLHNIVCDRQRTLPFVLIMSTVCFFPLSLPLSPLPPYGRKDDRGLRVWLGKPATD